MDIVISKSSSQNLMAIKEMLEKDGLPTNDLEEKNVMLFVGELDDSVIACIGLEVYDTIGLLRSLSVKNEFRNKGIGNKMTQYVYQYCKQHEISHLYLLTTTADNYFEKHKFSRITRDKVPTAVKQTNQFRELCPESATVMYKLLK